MKLAAFIDRKPTVRETIAHAVCDAADVFKVPIMGMIVSLGLMAGLKAVTWIRLVVWLIVGMVIYFTYGVKHSKVRNSAT